MPRLLKCSFSTQVSVALISGIFTGLFFGEQVAWLSYVGTAFIKTLQIAVTPYIVLSLVTGLGSLSYEQSTEIAKKFIIMLLCFWALALISIFSMAYAYPLWESKDFFSSTQITEAPPINYYELYIPSNPFHSLANNIVPAIVVFSLLLGVALVNIKEKQQFLQPAIVLLQAFNKITKGVVRFLPIGIFAISAASAGTMQADDFAKLEIYFVIYISTALILSFWVIPFFISSITPFKYADIIQDCRNILITAFAAGNLFILIPAINEACNDIFEKHKLRTDNTDKYNEIITPIAFNFPAVGKLLALTFILFSAWFTNTALNTGEQALLAFNGLFSLFASTHISIPFLLDYLHLPSDLYQLFLSGNIVTKRFATLTSAVFLISLTLSSTAYLTGLIQFKVKKILTFFTLFFIILSLTIFTTHSIFNTFFNNKNNVSETLNRMQVDWQAPQNISYTLVAPQKDILSNSSPEAIVNRGSIRIGYNPARVPFSFYNANHQLVGFDIEMMNHLSSALDVKLELFPFKYPKNMYKALNNLQLDIVISGVHISSEYLESVLYTQPTLHLTTAVIVKDFRKHEFSDHSAINKSTHLKLATMDHFPRKNYIKKTYPNIEFTKITNPETFFKSSSDEFDGFVSSIEEGMTLVMLNPNYAVSFDPKNIQRFPVGYAVHKNNLQLQSLLNSWLTIQKSTGRITKLYDYWIQGIGAIKQKPRWSILENLIKNNQEAQ